MIFVVTRGKGRVEVLYYRGDGIYIVKKESMYYLINLDVDESPLVSKYVDSFLKFGYFEPIDAVEEDTYKKLEDYLERAE